MTARASDVAMRLRELLPGVGKVKLHKLLYYVQGHHLAWHGRPAFSESVQAWINGPVVAELWRAEKYDPPPEPGRVDGDVLEVIHMVASRYGHLSGKDLIKLTHSEDPWRELSESEADTDDTNAVISHDALIAFFAEDHRLTPAVRARVAEVKGEGDSSLDEWVPTGPGELDDIEARYAKP